ncbi:MAG: ATP synthase subunit I [Nitrosomonas sp.]|uniref:ATP synthase subunit I n=1 Tax=Nitrosomonas sp. TaxID=42353 RepID=UPI0025F8F44A|nr:ATP synthase subunit I [Nitrosomonas sp.]MCG7757630.1 ATP synthase subunit I [Nitrosomonas sp.]UJP01032.1 MAG: ATP synthase subunit I [Nitrosomonas sp.]UJP03874.1 MAG: ATP synthase subunit I [Nitrosomonas sp.]UJP07568.1 MAG: ATP synthase subunit I [Nitrosomonas sp.]
MSWIKNRPLKIVLHVQLLITLVVAVAIGIFLGVQSAISAALGGSVSVISSAAYAIIVSHHKGYTAGETVRTALRAESVKIILTVSLLWAVFKFYEDLNAFAFIGTFILTVLAYSMALLVSDDTK